MRLFNDLGLKSSHRLLHALSAFALLLPVTASLPATAFAQDSEPVAEAPSDEFREEVVVTARRREENIQQTPVSVTAFGETEIQERSMTEISHIGDFTPNLNFVVSGGFGHQSSEAAIVIRGVGQIDTAIFADPGVGMYIDGVFLARAQGGVLDLLDVERVEVMRGPQGTLFGKNSTGGAVNLVTKRPTGDFSSRLELTTGEFDRADLRFTAGGALAEDWFASVALMSTNREGFTRSLTTGQKLNDDERLAGRVVLNWTPNERTSVNLSADSTREREAGANQVLLSLVQTPLLDFSNRAQIASGGTPVTEAFVPDDLYTSFNGLSAFMNNDVYGTSLDVQRQLSDSASLTSITSWRGLEFDAASDGDGTPTVFAQIFPNNRHDQFSQEIQLSGLASGDRLNWLVGGMYFREKPREDTFAEVMIDLFPALEAAPGPIVAPPGAPPFLCDPFQVPGVPCFGGAGNPLNLAFFGGFGGNQSLRLETESVAVFAEVTYALADNWSATLGARYTQDEKSFSYVNVNAFGVTDSDLFNEDDWDELTPRLSLAWQARPEVLFYLSAANGYKSGGFNGRPQQRQALDAYDPETVWTYELGWKTDLAGRKVRLNGAAFFSDYKDIQFGASLDVNGTPVFVTQNAGDAEISGFELELTAYPISGMTLTAGVGHTDTELVELDPRVPAGLQEGGRLPKAPDWTGNFSLQHTFEIGERGFLIPRVDYSYRSKVYNDYANTEAIAQDAYDLINLRLLYAPVSDRWDIAAFVTNAADEEYLSHGFFAAAFGFNIGLPGRPREWGLTAQWRF